MPSSEPFPCPPGSPVVIGLTGGIGSGKSTASRLFQALDVPVIDADEISRKLVVPGAPSTRWIADTFGQEILDPNGALRRAELRQRVFADPRKRKQLEAYLHPLIRTEMQQQIQHHTTAPYVILAVPLLLETDFHELVDRVLVIDVPEALQVTRVMQRDEQSKQQVEQILATQLDRTTRLSQSDDILDNQGSHAALREQVGQLHRQYLELAQSQQPLPVPPSGSE
ncbi:MAG: dephospho-CoA kinase [bacterium]